MLIINYKNLVNCQQLQSPCPETITTTSVAREKLKMLMSKTHTQTHTHTHNSDTQTSETPEEKHALETSRALLEFRPQEGKQHSEMQVEECVLTNERVQVRLSSIPGYRSGDSFLWTCRADFPQYSLSLSLSLSHTHTHTHTVGASQRGKLAASHRVSIEKGEWISEEIVYCKRRVFIASARGQNRGDPQGKKNEPEETTNFTKNPSFARTH